MLSFMPTYQFASAVVRVYGVDKDGIRVEPPAFKMIMNVPVSNVAREIPVVPKSLANTPSVMLEAELLEEEPIDDDHEVPVVATLRSNVRYEKDEIVVVDLLFEDGCLLIECGAQQTCHRGECVGACTLATNEDFDFPACSTCEVCGPEAACVTAEDGFDCGCEGDVCNAGECIVKNKAKEIALGERVTCAIGDRDGIDVQYCWYFCP